MPIKIENHSQAKVPLKAESTLRSILSYLPKEHTRGLEKFRFVDFITDSRVRARTSSQLPALYHPKQGSQLAWAEIAIGAIIPTSGSFFKKILPRLTFKSNLAAIIISLVGQHYYLTLRHSVKKGQLENNIRTYTEKQLKGWHEQNNKFRTRIFKPLQPYLEKWARSLRQRTKK